MTNPPETCPPFRRRAHYNVSENDSPNLRVLRGIRRDVASHMTQMVNCRSRMDAVQAPIVAVIGEIIRQVPGTISLGQGVVHYGPPPAALNIAREALAHPDTHGYQEAAGSRAVIGAIESKLRR